VSVFSLDGDGSNPDGDIFGRDARSSRPAADVGGRDDEADGLDADARGGNRGAVEPVGAVAEVVAAAVTVLMEAMPSAPDLDQRAAPVEGTIPFTDASEAVAGDGDADGIGSYVLVSRADVRVIALEYRPAPCSASPAPINLRSISRLSLSSGCPDTRLR
jgi:hypothetical protein